VVDPAGFAPRTPKGSGAETIRSAFLATAAPLASDAVLAEAQASIPDALKARSTCWPRPAPRGRRGRAAPTRIPIPTGKKDDQAHDVTHLLQTAAGIIELQLGTQIIVIAAGGFDTHSDQAKRHPQLLGDVGTGLAAFLDTMQKQGRANDVLVMTSSEFGRRVQENGSGTDHGNGGVQFLVGPMVKGGQIIGQSDLGSLDEGDLKSTIDTRSLYANALDWLSGPNGPADTVLGKSYDRFGLVTT
jgi:uncharacterized protein (DUF1501 family)